MYKRIRLVSKEKIGAIATIPDFRNDPKFIISKDRIFELTEETYSIEGMFVMPIYKELESCWVHREDQ